MRKSVIDQVEVTRDGHLQVRLLKKVIDNGVEIDIGYHRTVIPVGGNVELQMQQVATHLASLEFPLDDTEELAQLKQLSEVVFKPAKVAAFAEKMAIAVASLTAGKETVNDADTKAKTVG